MFFSKQKINTNSSYETEIVGASEYIPWILWLKIFLLEQGHNLRRKILYQDNENTMKMESNGRKSSS